MPAQLVDCYQLREAGRKLAPDVVKLHGPVRGWLTITTRANKSVYPGEAERLPWLVDAVIDDEPDGEYPHRLSLQHVVVARQTDAGVLLHGRQSYGNPYAHTWWPQAWWCVFVEDAEAASGARPRELEAATT